MLYRLSVSRDIGSKSLNWLGSELTEPGLTDETINIDVKLIGHKPSSMDCIDYRFPKISALPTLHIMAVFLMG